MKTTATKKKNSVVKKIPKQVDWKRTGWEERVIHGDDKELNSVWKEMWSRYGPEFKFRSGRPLTREWFDDSVFGIRRRAEKQESKGLVKSPSTKTNISPAQKNEESSKRTVPASARFAPKPEASSFEFGSLALDRDMCYKFGNNVFTLDDLVREKNKDGWFPVFLYKEGMDKNIILFCRSNSDQSRAPLQVFETKVEPQVVAKELIETIKDSSSVQSSLDNVVDYLLEEKEVPNVDRMDLMNGILRATHKILMVLLEQGQIRPKNKK